jgi:hypothetical protein
MSADMQRRTLLPKDVSGFQTRERSIDPPGIFRRRLERSG